MKHFISISTIIIIISACNTHETCKPGNMGNGSDYKREINKNTYGFVNSHGDTVIPFGKYRYLDPIDENGMIYAQKDDKYGYIDINEKILIPFVYDQLGVFSEGLAPARYKGKFGYIDRRGNVIIHFQFENESYFYRCGLAKVRKNNKWGFINQKGEPLIPVEYSEVDYNEVDSLVIVKQNGKWAFFNNNGKQLTDFVYDEVLTALNINEQECFMDNGLILVRKGSEYGYLSKDLKEVIGFGRYKKAEPLNRYGFAIVSKDSAYGIINSKGQLEVPLKFDSIKHPEGMYGGHYEEYYAWQNGRVGLINEKAELVTDIIYDDFKREYVKVNDSIEVAFLVRRGNKFGVINNKGVQLLPVIFDQITLLSGDSIVIAEKSGKYGLINLNGKTLIPIENRSVKTYNEWNFYIISNGHFAGIIDKLSKKVVLPFVFEEIEPCFYDENNRFIVKKNGHYGIITRNMETVIPIEYDYISNWVEYGPQEHFVTKNGRKGLVSRDGKIVIPPVYDEIEADNPILIKVKKNGLYGTVNWQNQIVHQIQYEFIGWEWPDFKGKRTIDTIYLKKSGKYFTTDTAGNVLRTTVSEDQVKEKFGYFLQRE